MNLLDLFVKIGVKDEASDKVGKLSSKLGNGLKTAAKVGAAAVGAATTAVTALGTAAIKSTSQTAEYADSIDKMSQKMGMTAEAYQEWDFIMQHSGTSMETLKASMKTLANAADTNSDAFARLGITQQEIAGLSQQQLFERTLQGLQGVTNETERTALAGKLLGRGATELGPLLNTSAEDVKAMRKQVHDLGGVMSDEAVKAGAAYQDSLQNLHVSLDGLKRGFSSDLLPSIVDVMDGMAAIFSGDESGFGAMQQGVDGLMEKLVNNLPVMLNAGSRIVSTIVHAIINNLPKVVESGFEIIKTLAKGLIDSLPTIIDTGVNLLLTLIDSIASHPEEVISTAIQLIVTLATGLINAIPKLITAAGKLVTSLVKGLWENRGQILQAGVDIVQSIIDGIASVWNSLVNWFNNLWDNLFGHRNVNIDVNANASGSVDGSHAGGLNYVPFDGYIAELHKGERVLTASESRAYNNNQGNLNSPMKIIVQSILDGEIIGETAYNYSMNKLRAEGI